MKIYQLNLFYDKGELYRTYNLPRVLAEIQPNPRPPFFITNLFFLKYSKLNPGRLADYEMELMNKNSEIRLDAEFVAPDIWCVSRRFKDFIINENISLDFFPVKVERENRYLMFWRGLPVISGYETDITKSQFMENGKSVIISHATFRSDIIEHNKYRIFSCASHIYIFITDKFKEKLEKNNFLFSYNEFPVTQKKYNEQKIQNDIKNAAKIERELWLVDEMNKRLQEVDDTLEKVLVKDRNKEVLEKFRNEMKGIWKKDFERYKQGVMDPLERITYW